MKAFGSSHFISDLEVRRQSLLEWCCLAKGSHDGVDPILLLRAVLSKIHILLLTKISSPNTTFSTLVSHNPRDVAETKVIL